MLNSTDNITQNVQNSQVNEQNVTNVAPNGIKIVNEVPKGWRIIDIQTVPVGYEGYTNGKSLFSGERETILVKTNETETNISPDDIQRLETAYAEEKIANRAENNGFI